jgi:hypothetical protein
MSMRRVPCRSSFAREEGPQRQDARAIGHRDLGPCGAAYAVDAVMPRKALVQECVVRREELFEAPVRLYQVVEEELRLPPHRVTELAVVMGRSCRRVKEADALEYVRGYTIGNDLVVRDFVTNFYRPPVKAKGFDTFCPLGPVIIEDEIDDPQDLELRAYVNGELRQKGSTSQMIRSVAELIAYVSEFMTLDENDIILTGTPKGISHVRLGDVMRLEIDGIGVLENPVVAEPPPVEGSG